MGLPPPSPESTCVITGASSGIGAEIARELARRGYGVTLVARREDRLRELAGELGPDAGVHACDITDELQRKALAGALEERGVVVDMLVNNAGFSTAGLFWENDPEGEVGLVKTNVEAVVALCAAFVPGMVERGRGAVLNVASTASFQPLPLQASYAASKAFVLSFTDALHAELKGTGVTATSLCPGPVKTEFVEVANLQHAERSIARLPLGRPGGGREGRGQRNGAGQAGGHPGHAEPPRRGQRTACAARSRSAHGQAGAPGRQLVDR